jgi:peroxiredoxin
MPAKAGDAVPNGEFKCLGAAGVETVTTADVFAAKRVLVIGVLGAFTPVCTARHLPEYLPYSEELTKAGMVDAVVCISAVDPFVMKAWGRAVGVGDRITLLTDTNAAFAESLGLAIDLSELGLGRRSTRYALFVDDGVIEIIRVEAQPGDLVVTSAEALRELIGSA